MGHLILALSLPPRYVNKQFEAIICVISSISDLLHGFEGHLIVEL